MSSKDFRVTFRGEVMQGWDQDEVKVNMAALFKLDPKNKQHSQKLQRLFSGRTVIIKDGLDAAAAQAYVDAIAKVGGDARAKKKTGPPSNMLERRMELRRKQGDRRRLARLSAIMPSRRKNRGRRHADLLI